MTERQQQGPIGVTEPHDHRRSIVKWPFVGPASAMSTAVRSQKDNGLAAKCDLPTDCGSDVLSARSLGARAASAATASSCAVEIAEPNQCAINRESDASRARASGTNDTYTRLGSVFETLQEPTT